MIPEDIESDQCDLCRTRGEGVAVLDTRGFFICNPCCSSRLVHKLVLARRLLGLLRRDLIKARKEIHKLKRERADRARLRGHPLRPNY